ncbi:choice-of-anchor A family protein, partial [Nocardioides sp.]|uniref:choice-of-anchor A family protein n=1 Tax=Nocardioides sp. TaxID=35761 RepID=UPI002ED8650F
MSTSASSRARRAISLPYVAALAVGVVTLGGLQTVAVDRAGATPPSTCVATPQPLGAATGWTEFVETDGVRGAESEGAIAYGGDHSAGGMTVGTRLPAGYPASSPALVVAGSHGTYNLQRGSAYVAPATGVNFNGGSGTGYLAGNPVDFATAFGDLRARSAAWGAAPATGTVVDGSTGGNAAYVLTGTDPQLNVFTMTAAQLGSGKHLGYDVPAGSAVLVNVLDASVTINGQLWVKQGGSFQQANDTVMESWPGVLWNFPHATSVAIDVGSAWGGSILAPNAALSVGGGTGHTIGQMIARSFSSGRETHQRLFPDSVCLPPSGPPSGPPDVKITKTASDATPDGGDLVTYDLLVENVGLATATGVVVTDPLPSGVTFDSAGAPCTQAAGVVTCALGDLAAGASRRLWVTVVADPVAGAGPPPHPQATHWLTPYKSEQQVDLEPGEMESVAMSCRPGDILADGSVRIDHVDQGTGAIADDVHVLSAQTTGLGTWKAVVRNDATGRAQAKAFVTCLPAYTEAAERQTGYADSHRHPLSADLATVTTTAAYAEGRSTATLGCPVGTVPIVPGYALSGGAARLVGSEYDTAHPREWTFTLDVSAPTTATLSIRCLRTTLGPVYGHTHELRFTHVVETVTVAGHTAPEGDEFQVICPDDGKGVVATWDLPPGVRPFGNDPRLKERAFRLFNDSGTPRTATLDLVCLRDRTGVEDMGTGDPVVVVNTATVTSGSVDANAANNASSATITVQPGTATAGLAGRAAVRGAALTVRVVSSMPGRAAVVVRRDGVLLARGGAG